jgi:RHS repeat-associated protein
VKSAAGVSGTGNLALAGSGTETFSYDAANRLVASGFGAPGAQSETRTYTYDPDSNRTQVVESGVTFYYTFDATDALVTRSTSANPNLTGTTCSQRGFCYDAFGDLVTSTPSAQDSSILIPTTYTLDPAGHLTAISDGTSADAVSFTLDALGRHATRTVGTNPVTTYSYLGTSDSITTIASSGGTTYSTIDAIGDRLCTGVGTSIGWIVPDLHGNVAAAVSSGPAPAFVNAFRFDPYGETVANWTASAGSVSLPWRYQGRMLESAGSSTSSDLYDFAARSYDPSLGAFTSFDSMAGSAQNPATLNRYLYANANPATLVDPDGHCASGYANNWNFDTRSLACTATAATLVQNNITAQVAHFMYVSGKVSSVQKSIANKVSAAAAADAAQHHCDGIGACLGSFASGFANGALNMPGNTVRGLQCMADVNCAGKGGPLASLAMMPGVSSAITDINMAQNAWKGDYYSVGQTTGNAAASAAVMVAMMGAGAAVGALRGLAAVAQTADATAETAALADETPGILNMRPLEAEPAGLGCSFTPTTTVATATGSVAIASIRVGDTVMAYDPKTGVTGPHTVSAVMAHSDPAVEHLGTDSGAIDTTPNHPFFTTDRGWVDAGSLRVGEKVRTESGGSATVTGFTIDSTPTTMWDLTVDGAHSFFVGSGAVLVHNCPPVSGPNFTPEGLRPVGTSPWRPPEFIPSSESPFAQEVLSQGAEIEKATSPANIHPEAGGLSGASKWLAIPVGGAIGAYVLCHALGWCSDE